MQSQLATEYLAELARQGRRGSSYYALYDTKGAALAPRLMWKAVGELLKSAPAPGVMINYPYLRQIERDYARVLSDIKRGNQYIYALLKLVMTKAVQPLHVTSLRLPCRAVQRYLVNKAAAPLIMSARELTATRVRAYLEQNAALGDLCTLTYYKTHRVFVVDLVTCESALPINYMEQLVYDQETKVTLKLTMQGWSVSGRGYPNYLAQKAARAVANSTLIALPSAQQLSPLGALAN